MLSDEAGGPHTARLLARDAERAFALTPEGTPATRASSARIRRTRSPAVRAAKAVTPATGVRGCERNHGSLVKAA
jgi:hypothetical protein